MNSTTLQIPLCFKLFGETWYVNRQSNLTVHEGDVGRTHYDSCIIDIEMNIPIEKRQQVFFHEITHIVLNRMGLNKLNDDETKVDFIGSMLHQIISSATYE